MLNGLSMAAQAILGRFTPQSEPPKEEAVKTAPKTAPLPVEDARVQRMLRDFFESSYYPYVRDLLMNQITLFQMKADKQLMGSLCDPNDSNGRMSAYHGGRIKAGEELKLILERLMKNFTQ